MKISRRAFILGGAATIAAAGASPILTGCSQRAKSGLDFSKFETNGVGSLGLGLENVKTSNVPTKLYNIGSGDGAELCVTNFGARIVSLVVPGKNGEYKDVVLGFGDIRDYANFNNMPNNFYGAVCGRYANRIKNGQWTYKGKTFQVDTNEKTNMLHGGKFGYHFQTFDVADYDPSRFIKLVLVSEAGDMGFPGRSTLEITYTLSKNNTLGITYEVKCTEACPINVSNHTYWCPSGDPTHPITDDNLTIYSKSITPVDSELIPTGEIRTIEKGSVFDFFGEAGEGKLMGRDKDVSNEQLTYGKGYDHNFVLLSNDEAKANGVNFDGKFEITDDNATSLNDKAHLAAKVKCKESGITMTIVTTEPGLQFFDCHDLDGSLVGKNKKPFEKYAAFVLEPQHYPDSPNHPNFPNTILSNSEIYRTKSEYRFTVD